VTKGEWDQCCLYPHYILHKVFIEIIIINEFKKLNIFIFVFGVKFQMFNYYI